MNTILFTNPGEIDPRSISSFGVSVKESENPIGFFGTGLKYAIAVLLRTGHRVTIMSGLSVIRFDLDAQTIRGKEFQFITMAVDDGAPVSMGYTTELGKKWEVWMAYREISCNGKDEGGTEQAVDYCPDPEAGVSKFIVSGAEFAKAYGDRHLYILQDKAAFTVENTEVRRRPGMQFYYRGVRVHGHGRPGVFTYNQLGSVELTEDRTLKYQSQAESCIRNAILHSDEESFIRECVTAPDSTMEGALDYHGWGIAPSETFLRVVGECMNDRMLKVNQTAARLWRETTRQKFDPPEIGLTKVQLMSLSRALDFCGKIGYPIRDAYPIKVVESLGDGGLGLALDGTIFIAEAVFHMGGTKQLASTLIEEYLHLRHGWEDFSRAMQNHLFEKMISLGEELTGEPL